MNLDIPFLCAPHYAFGRQWLEALNDQFAATHSRVRIVSIDAMSEAERLQCKVAIVANPNPTDLNRLPALVWVHSVWAGVERLLAEVANPQIGIVRLVDPQLADTMAEAVLAWTLYLHRDMPYYAGRQQKKDWAPLDYRPASQKHVGILGLGELGMSAAQRLQQAGFNVSGWSRTSKPAPPGIATLSGQDGLLRLLGQSDIVVCLLPLTQQTNGLLNLERLSVMRADAGLINFARGPLIDDDALHDALNRGAIRHVVLDVFEREPLGEDAWQWIHPRVTVLPHISAPTNRRSASEIVARNIQRYLTDGTIPSCVDRKSGY